MIAVNQLSKSFMTQADRESQSVLWQQNQVTPNHMLDRELFMSMGSFTNKFLCTSQRETEGDELNLVHTMKMVQHDLKKTLTATPEEIEIALLTF